MKFKKKNILITGVVITFIVTILISGGTFAYLKDKTDKTVNNFNTNKVIADITETENIIILFQERLSQKTLPL